MPYLAAELQSRPAVINARRALKHLHDRFAAVYLQHLPAARGAITQLNVYNLRIHRFLRSTSMSMTTLMKAGTPICQRLGCQALHAYLDSLHNDQGSADTADSPVLCTGEQALR